MKNFKKVLALVLVVATLLSFATIASAKVPTDAFTDKKDIKADYSTAVDVLTYLGVLAGYPNKTFRPQGEITRAEAAKIIAMLDNGSSEINGLYASANPFTDSKGHWAESFIAYCYKTGVIDGIGNLKFAPDAKVTGVQFLKMTLIVLGYDAKKEGLTGASWAVNTLALAKKAGLLAGLGYKYDYSANLTREAAAQIMLNALNSQIVDYGYEFKPGENVSYVTVAGAVVVDGVYLRGQWNIGVGFYTDAFERPGYKYFDTSKNNAIITSSLLTPEVTYTTKISECKLLEDLGIPKTDVRTTITLDSYLNGAYNGTSAAEPDAIGHDHANVCLLTALLNTHQGTLTEVYDVSNWGYDVDGNHAEYRVVSIDTWLAKVINVSKTTDNRVGHRDGNTPLLTLTPYWPEEYDHQGHNIGGECTGMYPQTSETVTTWTYAAEGFAEGDKVLVTKSYKSDGTDDGILGVQSVDLAKSESAKLVGFDHSKDNDYRTINVGGTDKGEAYKFEYGYNYVTADKVKATLTFYYDAYGNVIGIDTGAPTAATYSVIDSAYYVIENGAGTVKASIVDLDAKASDVELCKVTPVDTSSTSTNPATAANATNYSDFSRYAFSGEATNRDHLLETMGNEWAYEMLLNTTGKDAYGRLALKFAAGTKYYALYNKVVLINEGDKIQIDTRTGEYLGRSKA